MSQTLTSPQRFARKGRGHMTATATLPPDPAFDAGPGSRPSILSDWTAEHTARFQKSILGFGHDLAATNLFTDQALAAMLDAHPESELDVCTMGDGGEAYPDRFRTGDFRGADGATLVRAAKEGRIWINARRAMNIHPEYQDVMGRMYGDLAQAMGRSPFNARGGILISSPIARVPYHTDKTETILWHVRGRKRIFLYPDTEDFLPERAYEATLTDIVDDDIPYDASLERGAQVVDLVPGRALTWPLNSPHRVENQTFCVSVTTEYSTPESALKNNAMLANAVLRARFGLDPSFRSDGALTRRAKSVAGRVLKKAGLTPNTSSPDYVTFKVTPAGELEDVEPFVRDF